MRKLNYISKKFVYRLISRSNLSSGLRTWDELRNSSVANEKLISVKISIQYFCKTNYHLRQVRSTNASSWSWTYKLPLIVLHKGSQYIGFIVHQQIYATLYYKEFHLPHNRAYTIPNSNFNLKKRTTRRNVCRANFKYGMHYILISYS